MISLLNLLLAAFVALSPPAPAAAQAATARQAPPPLASKTLEAASRAAYKEMLDETQKINETCVRDHFGKACIAAQEAFQRKFLKQVPKYDPATLAIGATLQPKPAR
jgi:hypothetical protein